MGEESCCSFKKCCCSIVGVLGVIFVIAALCFLHFFPILFHNIVEKQVVLTNNSTGFQEWANPPAPIFLEFYVWDWDNYDEVKKGAKPSIRQKGPYVYREDRPKVNISENGNGTVSYISPQTFYFDRERSVGDPEIDTVTTLDVPYLTVLNQAQYLPWYERDLLMILIAGYKSEIHVTKPVQDILWGYVDPLLKYLKEKDPAMVPTDVYGLFAGKNQSNDGVYTVYTGETDIGLTNIIDKYNGQSSFNFWTTPQANMINGTDGTYNHPFVTKNDSIYVFSSDICRSIFALYIGDTNTRGVPTMRFAPPAYLFANYTSYPPNKGFCTPAFDNGTNCYPGGLLNISSCQFGAPVFMSSPHFLYADQSVLDMVVGVDPVEELHRTYFDIEPNTGGPLNVSKKLQINAHLRSYSFDLHFKGVPEAYFPLAWINEHGSLTQESADQLKKELLLPLGLGTYGPWAGLGLGCLLVLLPLLLLGITLCRSKDNRLRLHVQENEPLLNGST